MKKTLYLTIAVLLALTFTVTAAAAPKNDKDSISEITKGEVFYSAGHYLEGEVIPTGFDVFGYNYQAHYFKGSYVNAYLGAAGFPPYTGDDDTYLAENPGAASHWAWEYRMWQIEMKWNDSWISNKDSDGDGKLDRHYGYPSYIGSGAWEFYRDWLYDDDGSVLSSSTCKIVAVPADAVKSGGVWYTSAGGEEIGPDIWGEFAIVQETVDGVETYVSPIRCGLGGW